MTPYKPTVIWDADDTICYFSQGFTKFLASELDDPSIVDAHKEWRDPSLEDQLTKYPQLRDGKAIDAFRLFEQVGGMLSLKPKPHMVQLLRSYHEAGVRTVIATARSWMDNPYGQTRAWLDSNDIPYDELRVTPYRGSKIAAFPSQKVLAFYDDNAHHAIECAPHAHAVYLLDKPWNRSVTDLPPNVMRLIDPDGTCLLDKE